MTLCELGRSADAAAVRDRLVAVLGDVATPIEYPADASVPADESDLASAFMREIVQGGCWDILDPPQRRAPPRETTDRAMRLYRLTNAWVFSDDADLSAQLAAWALRGIADGYALLTTSWPDETLARLPLPSRAELDRAQLTRRFGLGDWLAEHGVAVTPDGARDGDADTSERGDAGELDELWPPEREDPDAPPELLAAFVTAMLHLYDLRLALCDSARGRAILTEADLRGSDCSLLARARNWVGRLGPEHELAPAAMTCLLIAEGLFMSSRGDLRDSRDMMPSREMLGELVDGGDAELRTWIEQQGGVVPAWL